MKKNGFTLVAAVFILLIMALLAMTTSTFVSSDSVIAVKNYYSQDAFYIASSGAEYYLRELSLDSDWSSPPALDARQFSGGVFYVTTTDETKNRITFTVTGLLTSGATTYSRAFRGVIQRTAGGLGDILGEYVLYWGGGEGEGSEIGNNVTIVGDIFVNGDLDVGNNSNISGDAYSTGDIDTGAGTTVEGDIEEDVEPPTDPPTLETTYYDNQIAIAAGEPAGNWSIGNDNLSGWYYINGDITLKNNANISVTGSATIVATGVVNGLNNVTIGDNFTMIADGLIDLSNNIIIGESGLWYSSVGIILGNNAESGSAGVGEGTVFLTPGDMTFGNNVEYYGLVYCGGDFTQTGNNFYFEGNMIVGGDIDIDNNSTLVLNPDLVDADSINGLGGGSTEAGEEVDLTDWDEVY